MKHKPVAKSIFYSFASLFFFFVPMGCESDQEHSIPWVEVKLSIDLGINNGLKVPAYSMKIPEAGYSGVLVLCGYYDHYAPAQSEYFAYDATCTYEVSQDCSLEIESNSLYATCPCCGSKFYLMGGIPVEGPAPKSLKRYNIRLSGEKLWVYN
jgi:nitrite reductase/ring-hydroxylating ferredoxin subunit